MDKNPFKKVVWDFSSADVSALTSDEIKHVVQTSICHPNTQALEHLALVVPSDLSYGLGRVFKAYGAIASAQWWVELFRTKDDAFQWLEAQDGPVTEN